MIVLIILTIGLVGSILSGWAMSILWGWFVVPVFNVPVLSIPAAIGLALIVSHLSHQYDAASSEKRDEEETLASAIVYCLMRPIICVLIGFVVKQFM